MKLLKNNLKWDLHLDLVTNEEITNPNYPPTIGWVTYINSKTSKLYVENYKLYFSYENFLFDIKKHYYVQLKELNHLDTHLVNKEFCLFEKGFLKRDKLLLRFEYTAEINYNIPPFDYIDDEDSDWGLFVANIINNEKEKLKFIKQHGMLE